MNDVSVGYIEECLVTARSLLVVGDYDGYRASLRNIIKMSGDHPILGLDVDGVITDYVDIFKTLSNSWPGLVIIVSFRSNYDNAVNLLNDLGIYFDKLVLSPTLDKSEIIKSEKISIYIDDQDECVQNIGDDVLVLKVRNGGNFAEGKWLYSNRTGKLIGL